MSVLKHIVYTENNTLTYILEYLSILKINDYKKILESKS